MLETLLVSLATYYGLDWGALVFGLVCCYLLTNKNRWGFVLGILGCACGFVVAIISGQFGFIVYNLILIAMMVRGFLLWGAPSVPETAE